MKVREKWSTARKIWSISVVVLGCLVVLFFGAIFGGAGGDGVVGRIISGGYQLLILPLIISSQLIGLVFGESLFNLGAVLPAWIVRIAYWGSTLSVPITYFFLVQLVFFVIKKRKLKKTEQAV